MTPHKPSPLLAWDPVSKFLHWSTAALIIVMVTLGWLAVTYPLSPAKLQLFNWHKSLGLLVLAWVALRLAWRLAHRAPEPPADSSPAEQRAARMAHGCLYILMFAMPISGWVINSAADFPLKWFGLFPVPPLVAPDKGVQDTAETVHLILFWILLGFVLLHIAAAVHHHRRRRNDVLTRMLPFTRSRK